MTKVKYFPMLGHYKGECMDMIININNGIEEPTCGYQICNISQLLLFGGLLRRDICIYPSYYLGRYHSKLNDTRVILTRYEGSDLVYIPELYRNKNIVKFPHPIGIIKCEILIVDTQMVSKRRIPIQHWYFPATWPQV